jgi:anti-anti-sigma factor
MTPSVSSPALRLVRLPGEFGPMLRCFGELSVATAEALRRELALLLPLGYPALTLNLSGCTVVDVDGILAALHAYKELRRKGARLVIVAGTGRVARLLECMGIDRVIPIFADEAEVVQALRGKPPTIPSIPDWAEARAETISRWRAFQAALGEALPEEALRHLTGMTELCERSEELFEELPAPAAARCQFCPLFYALGGRTEDLGCQSALDPIIEAVLRGDRSWAQDQVERLIHTLEELPIPEAARSVVPVSQHGLCGKNAVSA